MKTVLILKVTCLSCLLFLSQFAFGQQKPYGEYIHIDNGGNGAISEEVIKIKGDSIWFFQKQIGKDIWKAPPKTVRFKNRQNV